MPGVLCYVRRVLLLLLPDDQLWGSACCMLKTLYRIHQFDLNAPRHASADPRAAQSKHLDYSMPSANFHFKAMRNVAVHCTGTDANAGCEMV